jgi:hypothetical protein
MARQTNKGDKYELARGEPDEALAEVIQQLHSWQKRLRSVEVITEDFECVWTSLSIGRLQIRSLAILKPRFDSWRGHVFFFYRKLRTVPGNFLILVSPQGHL